ncbi:unnamed protein product [Nezara viridula]|uniref:Uncharacterized protein n=1 Tax=Nezara viridula TaxID=85310 RepID=A0A9P0HU70_NEZVI|nr:unnamed protein product [Nezara viridula]
MDGGPSTLKGSKEDGKEKQCEYLNFPLIQNTEDMAVSENEEKNHREAENVPDLTDWWSFHHASEGIASWG